jgi:hypothetical protein
MLTRGETRPCAAPRGRSSTRRGGPAGAPPPRLHPPSGARPSPRVWSHPCRRSPEPASVDRLEAATSEPPRFRGPRPPRPRGDRPPLILGTSVPAPGLLLRPTEPLRRLLALAVRDGPRMGSHADELQLLLFRGAERDLVAVELARSSRVSMRAAWSPTEPVEERTASSTEETNGASALGRERAVVSCDVLFSWRSPFAVVNFRVPGAGAICRRRSEALSSRTAARIAYLHLKRCGRGFRELQERPIAVVLDGSPAQESSSGQSSGQARKASILNARAQEMPRRIQSTAVSSPIQDHPRTDISNLRFMLR